MTTAVATPDPRNSRDIQSEISTLSEQLSEHARAGLSDLYNATAANLNAAKAALAAAEHRELNEAAEAHRLRQARKHAGMDVDGSLKSAGFPTAGHAIADRLRNGAVSKSTVEHMLRDALAKPQDRR